MKVLTHLLNPISVIAMFAALCEASATTVLPYLDNENRQVYLWFLIAFPSALVVMFFLTLNFNNKVLYGPHGDVGKPPTSSAGDQDPRDLPLSSGQARNEFIKEGKSNCNKNEKLNEPE